MKHVSGKHMCKVLERHGWTLDHITGSHHVYHKPGQGSIPVPVHGNQDLKSGTQKSIMRAAGLKDNDL
jgi:predicted RNA binding protein YcfA (HicA-like mRNA interferase family)